MKQLLAVLSRLFVTSPVVVLATFLLAETTVAQTEKKILAIDAAGSSFAPGENVKGSWFEVGGISSGQGLLIDYFPDIDSLFVAWFTFEAPTTSKVGATDQRWLTALMGIDGATASGTLLSTSGGFFDTPRPDTQIDGDEVGTITIDFADCANAQLHYELPAEGLSGDIAIERLEQFLFPNSQGCAAESVPLAFSFFVTSTGNGAKGGNLGGLSGADAKCQNLATNGGAGSRTWHAYLSTDSPLVNARDRIGSGPWFNQAGTMVAANLTELHNNITGSLLLDEQGQPVPSSPLDHDILTGSTTDGNVMSGKTCNNWTDGTDASGGQVGHADIAVEDLGDESWNSQHDPQCSESALASTAGTGRIYCFAIN